MVTIQCSDFDIRKIMASGQCFRMTEKHLRHGQTYTDCVELVAFGKLLQIKQDGNTISFFMLGGRISGHLEAVF